MRKTVKARIYIWNRFQELLVMKFFSYIPNILNYLFLKFQNFMCRISKVMAKKLAEISIFTTFLAISSEILNKKF